MPPNGACGSTPVVSPLTRTSPTLMRLMYRSALRYIRRIRAGLVRVNGDTTGVDPHAPFGGMKGSSSGTREQGGAAREFYTEIKTVQINP